MRACVYVAYTDSQQVMTEDNGSTRQGVRRATAILR